MKKVLLVFLGLFIASGLKAEKLIIKNEGESSVPVFVGTEPEFKSNPFGNFVVIGSKESKEFNLASANYLVLGKYGMGQYKIEKQWDGDRIKLRFISFNKGYGAGEMAAEIEIDNNVPVLVIDGSKIK